jgi:hypothetical protein
MIWSVTVLQIRSIEEPFRSDPALASHAMRLLARAEYVGCLPQRPTSVLNSALIASVARCMRDAHIPVWLPMDSKPTTAGELHKAIDAMNEQLEMSPVPHGEWGPAMTALGEDLLAQLLTVSVSSVRRYSSGERETPQAVAERLHVVALLLADLAGSYNEYGVRRWFTRPRAQLGGRRPIDLFVSDFDADSADARSLQQLAASLVGAGAA